MTAFPRRALKACLRAPLAYGVLKPDRHDGDDGVPVIRIMDVHERNGVADRSSLIRISPGMDFEFRRTRIRAGELVVSVVGTLGRTFLVTPDLAGCNISRALARVQIQDGTDIRFVKHWMASAQFLEQVDSIVTGTAQRVLNLSTLRELSIPLPTTDKQRSIADFLDRKTEGIDALIAKKERFVELLAENRQALITQAVTKGLDPSVPTKDSAIDWIGTIPAHWNVQRVKHVARLESGHTPSKSVPEHWLDANDIPWVSLNDTKWLSANDYITDTAYYINQLGLQNSSARLLPARAVVFTRDATIGKAAITTRPMAVSQHLIAWLCTPRIDPEYLLRVFYAMQPALERYTFGATLRTIGMDDVGSLVTPVPPIDEQRRIVEHVVVALTKLDTATEKARAQIDRLREYRQALITAAVTGRLDVTATDHAKAHG